MQHTVTVLVACNQNAELGAQVIAMTVSCYCIAAAEIAEAEAAGEELLPLPVEPTLSEVLEEGISRLKTEKKTWKVLAACLLAVIPVCSLCYQCYSATAC